MVYTFGLIIIKLIHSFLNFGLGKALGLPRFAVINSEWNWFKYGVKGYVRKVSG